ncbi:1-acylglycerol-3-phosphate O-acyltransferase [Geranomyces variabilis]|nr:1-acylglycerol-3-phosphate O-acyltransferase [Geranomyces variabilis]
MSKHGQPAAASAAAARKTENALLLLLSNPRGRAPALAAASAILLLLLWRRSSRVRFFLRVAGFVLAGTIASLVGILVSPFLWVAGVPGNTNWVVARTMLTLGPLLTGLGVKVEGREILERAGLPAVLVCNHQSALDILGMGAILPKKVVVLSKKEIKFVPILGWFMALAQNVFIDRRNRTHAIETMGQVATYLKEKKYGLWLFPEGTRSRQRDDSILPFKKGAFHLAVQGQLPIVPVLFSTYGPCYDKKEMRFDSGTFTVKVLDPIDTTGLSTADVDALMERTRTAMADGLKTIRTVPSGSAVAAASAPPRLKAD